MEGLGLSVMSGWSVVDHRLTRLHQTGRLCSEPEPLRIGATVTQDELTKRGRGDSGKQNDAEENCRADCAKEKQLSKWHAGSELRTCYTG
jgi:hypothetical protein